MPVVGLTEILAVTGRKQITRPEEMKVKVAQSCLMVGDPMDCTIHRILQARILEWLAFAYSRGSSQPRNQTGVFCTAGGFFTN